jgi:hypothetical protein
MIRNFRHVLRFIAGTVPLFCAVSARADVPADYTGKPYLGTPSAIPGRVDLVNVDTGGAEISYHADHNRLNSAGYEPISGNDYRPTEKDLPNICKTNGANPDHWLADGMLYPSVANPTEYYIGYAHKVDWVKVTVNVQQAGKYNVSSNWASDGAKLGLSIWFNDGHSAVDPKHPKDGVNKSGVVVLDGTSDFHQWKAYPNFTTVDLSAGIQVMTFHLEQEDHLQYGFLQFDLIGGAGAGGMGGAGGSGGSAQAGAGGSSGADSTAGASGATTSTGGATTAGGTSGAPSMTAGAASLAGSPPNAAGSGAIPDPADEKSSCSVSGSTGRRAPGLLGALALFAGCAFLRRRARRH